MPKKRIALVFVAAFSMAGIVGGGAAAVEQHAPQRQESQQRDDVIVLREPYHLYNGSSNLFMLAKSWNNDENGLIDLWYEHKTGSDALREQWEFRATSEEGVARIKNVGSGLCLQPNPNKLDPHKHVVQKECDRGEREQWWNITWDRGLRISSFNNDNRVLAPYNGPQASHNIVLARESGGTAQRWRAVMVD
ncbi:Ricin-type beta-trefoil lectin domain-containing protein [Actinopolyspora xinjiangensis]|uniref:Ricin-type beta-trefoil lectin domain-containing protein n=1 Tax=Actinopolyspora xinjiangensis TaxID=405564 RepID=A0A1H0WRY6_9ACTN|nr:ricin-type beta-trefoil lectin domain protein [Actinopolyspora xinjiangensis]SDP92996.1 Ricin-type beta-trefoil lectin domain-containing protein [Actinopolyspora xinjiangensis]